MAKKNAEKKNNGKGLVSPAFIGTYQMSRAGALKLGEDMVKAGLATKVYQDGSWTWLEIPQDKVKQIPYLVPAFRAYFQRFSPKRAAWSHQPMDVQAFAEKATFYGVKLTPDGKQIMNEFDDESVKAEALKRYNGEKNDYPRAKEPKTGKGKGKADAMSNDDLIAELKKRGMSDADIKKAFGK